MGYGDRHLPQLLQRSFPFRGLLEPGSAYSSHAARRVSSCKIAWVEGLLNWNLGLKLVGFGF